MDSESRLTAVPLASQSTSSPAPRKSRFDTIRASMRGRLGRILFAFMLFLFGLLCGIVGIFVLLFAVSSDNSAVANPPATSANGIVVQLGSAYITRLVSNALQSSGLPGNIQDVQVTLASGDSATITGSDQISVLGIGTTRHFTIVIQPYIASCQ
ncbi:MAG: hypothetical protein ABI406_16375, partial [Ktedonobacteraceae bacterium]